jgi:glucose/mannose-6-phosphate isomerase
MMTETSLYDLRNELDSQGMAKALLDFGEQARSACAIGKECPGFPHPFPSKEFLILGMGGSAIGGDLLRGYIKNLPVENDITINVNRDYRLHHNFNENTNVIVSSYSGNTEETLESLEIVRRRAKRIVCISSGGELSERANKYGYPLITIPGGMQPRAALGYSFFPMLYLLMRSKTMDEVSVELIEREISDCLEMFERKANEYALLTLSQKPAYIVASKIHGSIPILYSGCGAMEAVGFRWRCQIQENSKNFAFTALLPESNHNEINGWQFPEKIDKRFSIVCLSDSTDHPKIKARMNAIDKLHSEDAHAFLSLESEARGLLARIFDMICLGDWVSFYLAMLNKVDPTPIPIISRLKEIMSKGKL